MKDVTIRAEMSRLRKLLGCLLVASPYRLVADVDADFLEVERLLHSGDAAGATRGHRGPLLVGSKVPGIVEARDRLERALRPAVARRSAGSEAPAPLTGACPGSL